ncbi:MAG TPA: cellulose binding domain-containing protein [Gammaproteobacteria bacterium]
MRILSKFFVLPIIFLPAFNVVHAATSCKTSLLNLWDDYYQLDVRVTNEGPEPINGWAVKLHFHEPARVNGSWNAEIWAFESTVAAGNCCDWNGVLKPGQSASFGVQGRHDGSFNPPACMDFIGSLKSVKAARAVSSSSSSSSSGGSSSSSSSGGNEEAPSSSSSSSGYPKSSPGTGGVECTVNPTGIWSNGYQMDVIVSNNGDGGILGWSLTLNFSEPANITQSWGANLFGGSTTTVSAVNANWNSSVAPGASVYFSIQGEHDGSFELPSCSINK